MSSEEWITTQEAAERLGVTTARIRQMVAEDQISARKMGSKYRGQWQIKASDIEERIHAKGVTETMRVKNRMTPNPIVANPKTNFNQALRLMQQNHIKHLPIVDSHEKLVGIVTQGDMLQEGGDFALADDLLQPLRDAGHEVVVDAELTGETLPAALAASPADVVVVPGTSAIARSAVSSSSTVRSTAWMRSRRRAASWSCSSAPCRRLVNALMPATTPTASTRAGASARTPPTSRE